MLQSSTTIFITINATNTIFLLSTTLKSKEKLHKSLSVNSDKSLKLYSLVSIFKEKLEKTSKSIKLLLWSNLIKELSYKVLS